MLLSSHYTLTLSRHLSPADLPLAHYPSSVVLTLSHRRSTIVPLSRFCNFNCPTVVPLWYYCCRSSLVWFYHCFCSLTIVSLSFSKLCHCPTVGRLYLLPLSHCCLSVVLPVSHYRFLSYAIVLLSAICILQLSHCCFSAVFSLSHCRFLSYTIVLLSATGTFTIVSLLLLCSLAIVSLSFSRLYRCPTIGLLKFTILSLSLSMLYHCPTVGHL